ncbi:MAG: autotransporter outer membrane beta-barrel domain-containing protein [Deltaproteobacteria bacterium]|nr:autotransporter outer membrane beta-barrel domain-containing protein [Deltaproteobacteria bacterium]
MDFKIDTIVFSNSIVIAAGDGGNGGGVGIQNSATSVAGNGGNGGNGGNSEVSYQRDVIIQTPAYIVVTSGNGALKQTSLSSAVPGLAGTGGKGSLIIGRDLLLQNGGILEFNKGTDKDSLSGALDIQVNRNLEIAAFNTATLNVTGNLNTTQDNILLNTLLLNPSASFITTANVYTKTKPTGGVFYQVRNLDALTHVTWETGGLFAPNGGDFDYLRFDLLGVSPEDTIVNVKGSGNISLKDFDPFSQHEKYLTNPDRPTDSSDPSYRTYESNFESDQNVAPAFITSPYATKRLHLKKIVLLDKTTGEAPAAPITETDNLGNIHFVSNNSSLGEYYNDFAFTAGLRRYYFDVYISAESNSPLIADNYYTADASKIYAQAAAAGLVANFQSFLNTQVAMDSASNLGIIGKATVTASVSRSSIKAKTGSHVKTSATSVALALSKKYAHSDQWRTTLGLFGEYSSGNYDTFSFIPRYGDVLGDGDVKVFGGGVFLKTIFKTNTFLEVSARIGKIDNHFKLRSDPYVLHPEVHSGKTRTTYWGAHVGVGQKFNLGQMTSLDIFGKYFFTYTPEKSFQTKFGDNISIDSVRSSKVRVGARVTQQIGTKVKLHLGIAGEHEFRGEIKGKNGGDSFGPVNTRGKSGIAEIGLSVEPTPNVSLSLNGFGVTGKQKGGGGMLSLRISF